MEVCIHVVNFSDCRLSILDWLERCRLPLVAWIHQESVGLYVSELQFFPSRPMRKLATMSIMEIHLDQFVLSVFFFFQNLLSSHPQSWNSKKKQKNIEMLNNNFHFFDDIQMVHPAIFHLEPHFSNMPSGMKTSYTSWQVFFFHLLCSTDDSSGYHI